MGLVSRVVAVGSGRRWLPELVRRGCVGGLWVCRFVAGSSLRRLASRRSCALAPSSSAVVLSSLFFCCGSCSGVGVRLLVSELYALYLASGERIVIGRSPVVAALSSGYGAAGGGFLAARV